MTGKIIHINRNRGWGFISSSSLSFTRIYFHWTHLEPTTIGFKELRRGMIVEFDAVEKPGKGYNAFHINVIGEGTSNSHHKNDNNAEFSETMKEAEVETIKD